ncbi:MAG TPA: Ig-like domain repeat protein [Candidatus Limnocylindrales bacterium]
MNRPADRRPLLRLVGRFSTILGLAAFGLIGVQSVLASGATPVVTVTSDTPTASFGDTVTFRVAVGGVDGPGTGTVDFIVDTVDISGAIALDGSGNASYDALSLSAGTHSVNVSYSGDGNYAPGSGDLSPDQVVDDAPTTTSLVSDVHPSVWGQTVTFTATVSSAGGTPTGPVDFKDGATDLGSVDLTSGSAQLSTLALAVGSHTVNAFYGATTYFTASNSTGAPWTQVVNKASSDTQITNDLSADTVTGQSYNVAVSVAAHAPGAGTPSGTVTLSDGSDSCLVPVTLVGGAGSCSFLSTSAGDKTLTATYSGDGNFHASTSAGTSHAVDEAATTASVSSNHHPSVHGQTVTFTASVSVTAPGGGTPTGTVTFLDSGGSIGTGTLNGAGQATLSTSTLTTATHPITVSYASDGNYASVTSPVFSQVVGQALTTTTVALTSGSNPSTFGDSVTFTATVAPVSPGAGTPSGTVQFKDGASDLGPPATLSSGQASVSTSALSVATHTITAVYLDDSDFVGSTSAGISQVVNKAASATGVVSDSNPSTYGGSVTFTATVTGGGSTPTGNVAFKDAGITLTTKPLSGGVATYSTSTLSGGSHAITAVYAGDANYSGSTGTLSGGQEVDKASLTVTANDQTRSYGAANPAFTVTYTGFVLAQDFNTSDLTGSPLCSTTATPASSVSGGPYSISCSLGSLASSDYSFTFVSGSLTIIKATSTTTVSSNHNPSVFGQTVTFTAAISGFGGGSASGTVDFIINGGAPQTQTVSGNQAVYSTAALAVGTYTVEADYSGDGNLTTSTDTLNTNQAVTKAASMTQITSDLSTPTLVGTPYLVAVSVTAVAPGAGTPSGTVTVSDGSATCPVTLSGGSGSCMLTSTTPGFPKTVTATYAASASFATSNDTTSHIVDSRPVANPDTYQAYEAGGSPNQLTVPAGSGVLANDTDGDGDTLTATNATSAGHGTVVLNADGSFTYTPTDLYVGADSFTYTANDGMFDSAVATVSITVLAVNQPPTFTLDTSTVTVNENQYDSAPDSVLGKAGGFAQGTGDTGQTLIGYQVSSSTPGLFAQLGINTGGTLTFKTLFGVPGSATITVRAQDSGGTAHGGIDLSPPQTFVIVVTYQNQAPIANSDVETVGQSSSANLLPVLRNDYAGPPDEQPGGGHPQTVTIASATQPVDWQGHPSGTVNVTNGATAVNFVPKPGFVCPASVPVNCVTFDYTVVDNGTPTRTSAAARVFITVASSTSRLAGSDRYATDTAIVTGNYGPSPIVYVASGTGFADGLAGAAAAGFRHAPLILVNSASTALNSSNITALHAVLQAGTATQIIVVGGTASVPTAIFNQLKAMDSNIIRLVDLVDNNRYDTAVQVSLNTYPTAPVASHAIFIADGLAFPDALSAAAYAGHLGAPLLLVPGPNANLNAVPKVAAEISRLAPTTVYIAGGPSVISNGIRAEIQTLLPSATLVPFSGANRYETGTKIADCFIPSVPCPPAPSFGGPPVSTVYIASGLNFPDALAGAALAGSQGAAVLLVPGTSKNLDGIVVGGHMIILDELNRLFPNRIVVFGGNGAISDGIFSELEGISRS